MANESDAYDLLLILAVSHIKIEFSFVVFYAVFQVWLWTTLSVQHDRKQHIFFKKNNQIRLQES